MTYKDISIVGGLIVLFMLIVITIGISNSAGYNRGYADGNIGKTNLPFEASTGVIQARKFISDCKAAGGEPVYDICAEKGFKAILLPGYDWSPEVSDYNNN